MSVLEVRDVYKKLGKREVIKGINFCVEEGEIFGFLGPNGAGKTTTIKMMVGLIHPDQGSIHISGADIVKNGNEARSKIGAVVENPEMYNYLSGMANLKMLAEVRNIPKRSIDEVVELVNLTDRIGDKVGKYSLGMKQRLGLACCLLPKPKLIILDEPTNGLDPSGIIDFRDIVKRSVKEMGASVFISSHILSEVEQLCTTVAFINQGEIKGIENITEGSMDNETEILSIKVNPSPLVMDILQNIEGIQKISTKDTEYTVVAKKSISSNVIKTLVEKNIEVYEVYKKHNSLEQRYMELVEGGR